MYLALYRKWRPKTFTDVCGQEHVTETLRAQIMGGRLSHAYLFTGSRGTGKTTCAKLLARAVNCLEPHHGDPCNQCESCKGILDGSILDVVEIDAASYSGVDHIRDLRDELFYNPVHVQKRVYIIDEVHMLSTGAFNALLKTLEEPPSHVLFILATTETHKVPATILSRCQRFAFRRIGVPLIRSRLSHIAQSEGITIDPQALSLIARMADGALRDAINLLDQCAILSEKGNVTLELTHNALGLSGVESMSDWLEAIASGQGNKAMEYLQSLYQNGRDWASLLDELGCLMRDMLMAGMLGDPSELRLSSERSAALDALCPRSYLLSALDILTETQNRLSSSVNKRIETELCLLRLCALTSLPQALESSINATPPKTSQVTPSEMPLSEPSFITDCTAPNPLTETKSTNDSPDSQSNEPLVPQAPQSANEPDLPSQNLPLDNKQPILLPPPPSPPTEVSAAVPHSQATPMQPSDEAQYNLNAGDERWRTLLENSGPFLANFLPKMSPICRNNTLILQPNDDYHANLLDKEFQEHARSLFTGGLVIQNGGIIPEINKERLDSLANRFEDLVSFE